MDPRLELIQSIARERWIKNKKLHSAEVEECIGSLQD